MQLEIKNPGEQELRKFGFITGAIAAVLFGLFLPWVFDGDYPLWPWIIMGILWIWALVLPATLWPVYRGWLTIGNFLGVINTRIILGLLFYIIVLPIGLMLKLFGKDPMAREIDKKCTTYRVDSQAREKDHMERPF